MLFHRSYIGLSTTIFILQRNLVEHTSIEFSFLHPIFISKMKKETAVYKRDEYLPTITGIFTIAKWFGIPVYGGKIAFWWAVSIFFLLLATEIGTLLKLIKLLLGWATYTSGARSLTAHFSGFVFYGNGLASFILSWRLISSWKPMFFLWSREETTTRIFLPPDKKIKRRVVFVTCLVAVCSTVEHLMSMTSSVNDNVPTTEIFRNYILNSHGFLLRPDEYSYWIGIPLFFVSKVATILWNFQDLIIILISMGLSSRYHRLNQCIHRVVNFERKAKETKLGTDFYLQIHTWRKLREAYVRQAALVRRVDKELGPLVVLSNINNFYFICLQLFLGINQTEESAMGRVYYFISLGWLLFRASSVVLAASDVNLHSRKALSLLNKSSEVAYNIEIKRLKNQLTYDTVALSGMGFFVLERKVLLQVAAAIIKYELVMLQFDK